MKILIRHVKKLEGSYGETRFPAPHRITVLINQQLNRRLASYASTLLHELLHVWIYVLGLKGFEVEDKVEHDFIYAAEREVLVQFRKIVGKKGGKP